MRSVKSSRLIELLAAEPSIDLSQAAGIIGISIMQDGCQLCEFRSASHQPLWRFGLSRSAPREHHGLRPWLSPHGFVKLLTGVRFIGYDED